VSAALKEKSAGDGKIHVKAHIEIERLKSLRLLTI
jgi:hypothetical protein